MFFFSFFWPCCFSSLFLFSLFFILFFFSCFLCCISFLFFFVFHIFIPFFVLKIRGQWDSITLLALLGSLVLLVWSLLRQLLAYLLVRFGYSAKQKRLSRRQSMEMTETEMVVDGSPPVFPQALYPSNNQNALSVWLNGLVRFFFSFFFFIYLRNVSLTGWSVDFFFCCCCCCCFFFVISLFVLFDLLFGSV